jgi:hypothetical protein
MPQLPLRRYFMPEAAVQGRNAEQPLVDKSNGDNEINARDCAAELGWIQGWFASKNLNDFVKNFIRERKETGVWIEGRKIRVR